MYVNEAKKVNLKFSFNLLNLRVIYGKALSCMALEVCGLLREICEPFAYLAVRNLIQCNTSALA